jgi:hypothetical protein
MRNFDAGRENTERGVETDGFGIILHSNFMYRASSGSRVEQSSVQSLGSPDSVQVLPPKQVAFERLDDCVDLPFGAVLIFQEILDAVPACRTVELTTMAFIKEFTVLLAHIFLMLFAIFDFHNSLSFSFFWFS